MSDHTRRSPATRQRSSSVSLHNRVKNNTLTTSMIAKVVNDIESIGTTILPPSTQQPHLQINAEFDPLVRISRELALSETVSSQTKLGVSSSKRLVLDKDGRSVLRTPIRANLVLLLNWAGGVSVGGARRHREKELVRRWWVVGRKKGGGRLEERVVEEEEGRDRRVSGEGRDGRRKGGDRQTRLRSKTTLHAGNTLLPYDPRVWRKHNALLG